MSHSNLHGRTPGTCAGAPKCRRSSCIPRSPWVHLRMCLECGHLGCCDSSKNRHATKHFHRSKHPLVRSVEPGEEWVWCYVDEVAPGELHGGRFVAIQG